MERSLQVANGRVIRNPTAAVIDYVRHRGKTITRFDLRGPGAANTLTYEEVVRTRRLSSRISNDQAGRFVDAGRTAPWEPVRTNWTLYDLDPESDRGREKLRRAHQLYVHFWNELRKDNQKGVANGKISKVLHLKRPRLVPILDSVMWSRYWPEAKRVMKEQADTVEKSEARAEWLAVRADLARHKDQIEEIRRSLAMSKTWMRVTDGADANVLTDLRLLDILVWSSQSRSARERRPARRSANP